MEEPISRIPRKTSGVKKGDILAVFRIWIRKNQIGWKDEKFRQIYRHRRRIHWKEPFLEKILRTSRYSTIFQERIDNSLEYKHSALLENIIIVTKGEVNKHEAEDRGTVKN